MLETPGKPIARVAGQIARPLRNWAAKDRDESDGTQGLLISDAVESKWLRAEVAKVRIERDVL